MSERVYLDVRRLPGHAFGSRDPMWWGTVGFMAIEGTMFAMLLGTYAYLRGLERDWPPPGFAPPSLLWGTINAAILLASLWPSWRVERAAESGNVAATRRWMVIDDLFGIAFIVVRALELGALNVRWDSYAYGSIVWTIIAFHTLHLLTDFGETVVLTVFMFTHPTERRLVDVSEDSLYWNFVVMSWIPLYLTLYWVPRWT
jgi:cytochrome c oxidase subunit III